MSASDAKKLPIQPINAEVAPPPELPKWHSLIHTPKDKVYTTQPKPRRWFLKDLRYDREGVIPAGKCGMLAAVGGGGKTQALIQLAKAKAVGGIWLGTLDTGTPGKSLLVLPEEDKDEADRRLYRSHSIGEILPPEGWITILPLAGVDTDIALLDRDGKRTKFHEELRAYIFDTGPYAFIGLDPLARLASGDIEKDNDLATKFVMAAESLIKPGTETTVIISHHTSQAGNTGLDLDMSAVRGVTGFVYAARFLLLMGSETNKETGETRLRLHSDKTNYSKKMKTPIDLKFTDTGAIVPMTDVDVAAAVQCDEAKRTAAEAKKTDRKEAAMASDNAKIGEAIKSVLTAHPGLSAGDLEAKVAVTAKKRPTSVAPVIKTWKVDGRIIEGDKIGNKLPHFLNPNWVPPVEAAPKEAPKDPYRGCVPDDVEAAYEAALGADAFVTPTGVGPVTVDNLP